MSAARPSPASPARPIAARRPSGVPGVACRSGCSSRRSPAIHGLAVRVPVLRALERELGREHQPNGAMDSANREDEPCRAPSRTATQVGCVRPLRPWVDHVLICLIADPLEAVLDENLI